MKITAVTLSRITGEIAYAGQFPLQNAGRLGRAVDVYPEYKAQGPDPVRLTPTDRPGVYQKQDLLLEVETDAGLTGIMTNILGADHLRSLAPHLLGRDPFATEMIWDILHRVSLSAGLGDVMGAIAAIDIALWDIKCQALGLPLSQLLGGPSRDRVPAYAMARDYGKAPEQVAGAVRELSEQGFQAVKWYPNWGPTDGPEGMRRNEALVATCREAAGPDMGIILDCWKSWDVPYTIAMARRLERYDIHWIEEPVFQYKYDQYAEIRRAVTSTQISGGEQLYALWQFRELFQRSCVDIVQPDPIWCGGITQIRKIVALAEAYDVTVIMHVCHVPLNIHLSAALSPAACPLIEYPAYHRQVPDQFFFRHKVLAEDGHVAVPSRPAIFELDPAAIRRKETLFSLKA